MSLPVHTRSCLITGKMWPMARLISAEKQSSPSALGSWCGVVPFGGVPVPRAHVAKASLCVTCVPLADRTSIRRARSVIFARALPTAEV